MAGGEGRRVIRVFKAVNWGEEEQGEGLSHDTPPRPFTTRCRGSHDPSRPTPRFLWCRPANKNVPLSGSIYYCRSSEAPPLASSSCPARCAAFTPDPPWITASSLSVFKIKPLVIPHTLSTTSPLTFHCALHGARVTVAVSGGSWRATAAVLAARATKISAHFPFRRRRNTPKLLPSHSHSSLPRHHAARTSRLLFLCLCRPLRPPAATSNASDGFMTSTRSPGTRRWSSRTPRSST